MMHGPVALLINSLGTGGAERAVALAATRLGEMGRDVRVLCLERVPSERALSVGSVVVYLSRLSTSSSAIRKLVALPVMAARLAAYVTREQVTVVMSHLFRANFVNILARILAGSLHRAILVNHTRVSRLRGEGIQGWINLGLCKLLYRRADLVASVSTGAAAECANILRIRPERSTTLYDPIDVAASEAFARRAQASHAIVGVGRLVGLKRFADLIDAFAGIASDFPNLELRLVGDGPDQNRLESRAAATGVSSRIRFLGRVADPAWALAGCAAFVSASETEGFGIAIVEAMAAGVPVISSDCAYGPREILAPTTDPTRLLGPDSELEVAQYGILYPVGSVKTLEKALRLLLEDSALHAELSRNGARRAADFSVERSTAAYERLLFPE